MARDGSCGAAVCSDPHRPQQPRQARSSSRTESRNVFGYADAIRERVWVEADFDTDLDGAKDRIALDVMRPAATGWASRRPSSWTRAPTTRPRPRQRGRAQAGRGRRRPARPLAALLRQLLRAARLRRRPPRHGRHEQLDRLSRHGRHAGPPERRRRHRLAERSEEGLRQERQRGRRRLAQRPDGDDREVV